MINEDYKHRAKDETDGQWAEGYYLGEGILLEQPCCGFTMCCDEDFGHMITNVVEETAGLCVKVGETWFAEGDIIEANDGRLYSLEFREGAMGFGCEIIADYHRDYHLPEIIGNKWDNPELLAKLKEQEAAE